MSVTPNCRSSMPTCWVDDADTGCSNRSTPEPPAAPARPGASEPAAAARARPAPAPPAVAATGQLVIRSTPNRAGVLIDGSWRGRTPLTVHEGICWLLQEPAALERNHCFMVVGSRRRQGARLDRRVPALWISGGSERDGGRARRGAPKLGWCWAGNRHTWLGFASAAGRIG